MKRCFIFSAGTFYGLREKPAPGDFLTAADAGYRNCLLAGLDPDLLVGDFDSMEQPANAENVLRVPVEKDDTDTMLAIKEGWNRGCREFYLYGCTGGKRLDHTLANFQALLWLTERGGKGFLYDDDFVFTAVRNGTQTVQKQVEWGLVSVFCLGEPAHGVTERGMQYSLTDADLCASQPVGVSNHFLDETAEISVRDGTLVVGWELPPLE